MNPHDVCDNCSVQGSCLQAASMSRYPHGLEAKLDSTVNQAIACVTLAPHACKRMSMEY